MSHAWGSGTYWVRGWEDFGFFRPRTPSRVLFSALKRVTEFQPQSGQTGPRMTLSKYSLLKWRESFSGLILMWSWIGFGRFDGAIRLRILAFWAMVWCSIRLPDECVWVVVWFALRNGSRLVRWIGWFGMVCMVTRCVWAILLDLQEWSLGAMCRACVNGCDFEPECYFGSWIRWLRVRLDGKSGDLCGISTQWWHFDYERRLAVFQCWHSRECVWLWEGKGLRSEWMDCLLSVPPAITLFSYRVIKG